MNFLSLVSTLVAVNSVVSLVALSFVVFLFLFVLVVVGTARVS